MSGVGGPTGLVVTYENVNMAITKNLITLTVQTPKGEKIIVVNQQTGMIESQP